MIESLNHFSLFWADLIFIASVQNSLFLVIIIGIIFSFRYKNASILRIFAIFGLIKLLIPPFISSSLIQKLNIPAITNFSLATTVSTIPMTNYNIGLTLQSYLMILWILIVFLILTYSIFNTYRFRSNFRQAILIDVNDYLAGPLSEKVGFYKSEHNHSPIVFGLFKIKIILPKDWNKWTTHQKRTVIIHELNHIKQKDHWINILKLFAFSIHFFNPLVWIFLKKLNELNELVCDDFTIATTKSSNLDYTTQLVHFSELYSNLEPTIPATLTFTESYKSLKNRLSYHLSKKEGIIMHNLKLKNRITTLICVILLIPFLGQCDKEQPNSIASETEISKKPESIGQNTSLYSFEDVSVKPEVIHKERPYYPDEARKNGIMGLVVVTVTIDEMGDVIEANILSTEDPALNKTSLEAAKKCKFKPAEIDGQPVKVNFNIPFKFALK